MYPGPKKYKLLQVANLFDSLYSSLYLCRRKDRSFDCLFLGKLVTDKYLPEIFSGKTYKCKNLPDFIFPMFGSATPCWEFFPMFEF